MKRIAILGATGSIGTSALDVVRANPGAFRVAAVAAGSNRTGVDAIGREFGAPAYCGEDAARRALDGCDADVAVVAIPGLHALPPVMAAIERGMDVALASKEALVAAGAAVVAAAAAKGVRILPLDSEHSAIFQCLQENAAQGRPLAENVARITLTASGGPFLDGPEDLSSVTPAQALAHPRWKMGRKVSVDSATLMNKGFEIAEAKWPFSLPPEKIDVVVHPESVIHSMVTFRDGSTLAQLAPPDMRLPIQYALSWPERMPARHRPLDLAEAGRLTFRRPDEKRFPALRIARQAIATGGTAPATLAAADEVAVERFLEGEIAFTDIARLSEDVLAGTDVFPAETLPAVQEAAHAARAAARAWKTR